MIIIIILISLLILGTIISKFLGEKYYQAYDLGGVTAWVSGFILIILLIFIGLSYATANKVIQENKIEYEGLCKRYEIINSEYEDISKSDVIKDITEWNIKVYQKKYWTDNVWTNWLCYPRKLADNLEYIQLERK